MLKFFRDQKDSWFVKGILILTALSFMSLFGLQGDMQASQGNKPVIQVGGRKILTQELLNDFNREVSALRRMVNNNFSVQDAVNHGMFLSVLKQTASRAVLEGTVEELGLTVSPDDVRAFIFQTPLFADANGEFSRAAFNEYLKNTEKTEKQFVQEIFLSLKAEQLLKAVRAVATVPSVAAEMAYRINGEQRTADVFRIAPTDLKIKRKPTRKELQEIYEEASENLIAPEYRDFTVMELTMDDVKGQIRISENELKDLYEQNKGAYTIEEIRNIDQMLFENEDEARAAYAELKKGRDFMKIAQEKARQTEDQTKLGDMTPSTATGEWADQVFAAKKGEIVGPVQTSFGWQILRVNSITPKVEKKYAEVRSDLEGKAKDALAFDKMQALSVALDDRLGAGEKLEDVAKSAGLKVKQYKMIDASGMDENGKDSGVSKDVLSIASISEPGRVSPMIEDGTGFFVLRIDRVQDPAQKSFEKALPEVTALWTAERQKEEAREIVKKIEEGLRKKQKPETLAKKYGVSYERMKDLTRHNALLPTTATYGIFARDVGGVVNSSAPNGYIVARVVDIERADPEKDVLGVVQLRRQMVEEEAEEKANTLLSSFGESLNLQIDEDAVKQALTYITRPENSGENF
ncbi:MAG: peptidyl-prolyl cis-trans isomerase [Alphaproteobacteria bacterium]